MIQLVAEGMSDSWRRDGWLIVALNKWVSAAFPKNNEIALMVLSIGHRKPVGLVVYNERDKMENMDYGEDVVCGVVPAYDCRLLPHCTGKEGRLVVLLLADLHTKIVIDRCATKSADCMPRWIHIDGCWVMIPSLMKVVQQRKGGIVVVMEMTRSVVSSFESIA